MINSILLFFLPKMKDRDASLCSHEVCSSSSMTKMNYSGDTACRVSIFLYINIRFHLFYLCLSVLICGYKILFNLIQLPYPCQPHPNPCSPSSSRPTTKPSACPPPSSRSTPSCPRSPSAPRSSWWRTAAPTAPMRSWTG